MIHLLFLNKPLCCGPFGPAVYRAHRLHFRGSAPEFKSSFQKYEPDALASVPVPRLILADRDLRISLTGLVEEIMDAVARQDASEQIIIEGKIDVVLEKRCGVVVPEGV